MAKRRLDDGFLSDFLRFDILDRHHPQTGREGGCSKLDIIFSFFISVMASVVAYYICKWLDRDE